MLMAIMGNMLPGVQSRVNVATPCAPTMTRHDSCTPRKGFQHSASPQAAGSGGGGRSRAMSEAKGPWLAGAASPKVGDKGDLMVFGGSSSSNLDRHRRIICYGDSNTVGYYNKGCFFQPYGQTLSSDLTAAGLPNEVVVCGLCSFTTQDMLNEKNADHIHPPIGPSGRGLQRILEEDVHTDLVIIMTGTNDIGMSTKPETIVRHVAQLHAICHQRGIQTVAVAPTQGIRRSSRRVRQRLADLLATWAKSTPGVVDFIDIEDLLPRPCGKDGSANMPNAAMHWEPDQLHLSAAGSKELGRRLAPLVSTWLRRTSSTASKPGTPAASTVAFSGSRPSPAGFLGHMSRGPSTTAASCPALRQVGFHMPTDFPPRAPTSCGLAASASAMRRQHRASTVPTFGMLAQCSVESLM